MSLTYAQSGVNIDAGDLASKRAYHNAKTTFASRSGLIGQPFALEGGFAGALDMGDYLLLQNDDGTGSKAEVAELMGDYSTLGQDLAAMVLDDAICVGAEVISLSNTFDVPSVEAEVIDALTSGLAKACAQQKVVIPGGEIAEVPGAVQKIVWNATSVGVVKKDKFITGKNIKSGQVIIGLRDPGLRSNGFSLARKICENQFGPTWAQQPFSAGQTWGQALLTPSKLFHRLLLDTVLGDFEGDRLFPVSGVAHITGGGVPGNLPRILPAGLGANLPDLHQPVPFVKELQRLGSIDEKECYRAWHCGTAMMIVCDKAKAEEICGVLNKADSQVAAQIVGQVTSEPRLDLISKFSGKRLSFAVES